MPQLQSGIYFWEDVFLLPGFKAQIEAFRGIVSPKKITAVLTDLINNDFTKGLGLEQLKDCPVYSCRLNLTHRMIFTTLTMQGKKYLLPLEIVINHDYDQRKFQTQAILIQFLKKHFNYPIKTLNQFDYCIEIEGNELPLSTFLQEGMRAVSPLTEAEHENISTKNRLCNPKQANYYSGACLTLNESQTLIAKNMAEAERGIIMGGPGAGKSWLAYNALVNQYQKLQSMLIATNTKHEDDDPITVSPLLFCCESERLRDQMKDNWDISHVQNSETHDDPNQPEVYFKTYRQILLEDCHIPEASLVGEVEFTSWYQDSYIKKRKMIMKAGGDSAYEILIGFTSIHDIYTQCRNYSCEFEAPAVTTDPVEKSALRQLYVDYLAYLESQEKIDMAFFTLPAAVHAQYVFIATDEVQDFTPKQLENLTLLTHDYKIFFFLDSHQSLIDPKTKLYDLMQLLERSGRFNRQQHIYHLSDSYRCSIAIIEYLNGLLHLKHQLFEPDEKEQYKQLAIKPENPRGSVRIVSKDDFEKLPEYQALAQSTEVMLIADTKSLSQLNQHEAYKTFVKINPSGAKGLEYGIVIAHGLLTPLIQLSKLLEGHDPKDSSRHLRALQKTNSTLVNENLRLILNTIYVTFSRAKEHLCIVETADNLKRLQTVILPWLQTQLAAQEMAAAAPLKVDIADQSARLAQMHELIELKEFDAAATIFIEHLQRGDRKNFEAYVTSLQKKTSTIIAPPIAAAMSTVSPTPKTPPKILEKTSDSMLVIDENTVKSLDQTLAELNSENLVDRFFVDKQHALAKLFLSPTLPGYSALHDRLNNWIRLELLNSNRFKQKTITSFLSTTIQFVTTYPEARKLMIALFVECIFFLEANPRKIKSDQFYQELKTLLEAIPETPETSVLHYLVGHRNRLPILQKLMVMKPNIPSRVWFMPYRYQQSLHQEIPLLALSILISQLEKTSPQLPSTPLQTGQTASRSGASLYVWGETNKEGRYSEVPLAPQNMDEINSLMTQVIKLIPKLEFPHHFVSLIPNIHHSVRRGGSPTTSVIPSAAKDNEGIVTLKDNDQDLTPLLRLLDLTHPMFNQQISYAIINRLFDIEFFEHQASHHLCSSKVLLSIQNAFNLDFLYPLLTQEEGLLLFSRILLFAPDLAKIILFNQAFYLENTFETPSNMEITFNPLFLLTKSPKGIMILNQILDNFGDVFEEFHSEIFERTHEEKRFLFSIITEAITKESIQRKCYVDNILFVMELLKKYPSLIQQYGHRAWSQSLGVNQIRLPWLRLIRNSQDIRVIELIEQVLELGKSNPIIPNDFLNEMVLNLSCDSERSKNANVKRLVAKINQYLNSSPPAVNTTTLVKSKEASSMLEKSRCVADEASLNLKNKLNELYLSNLIPAFFGTEESTDNLPTTQCILPTLTDERLVRQFTEWLQEKLAAVLPSEVEDFQQAFIKALEERTKPKTIKRLVQYGVYSEFLVHPTQKNIDFLLGWVQEDIAKPIHKGRESFWQFLTRHASSYLAIFPLIEAAEIEIQEALWFTATESINDPTPSIPLLKLFEAIVTFESSDASQQATHEGVVSYFNKIVNHLNIPPNFCEALEQPTFTPNTSYLNYLTDPSKYNRGSFSLLNRIWITNPEQLERIELNAWFKGTGQNYPFHHLLKTEVGVRFLSNMLERLPEYTKMMFHSIAKFIENGISPNNLFYNFVNCGLVHRDFEKLVYLLISMIQEQTAMIQKLTIHAWLPPKPNAKEVFYRMFELIYHKNPLGLSLASLLFLYCPDFFAKDVYIDIVNYLTAITESGQILDDAKTELLMWLKNKIETNTKTNPNKTTKPKVINVPSSSSFFNQSPTRPRRDLPVAPHQDSVNAASASCDEDVFKPH